MCCFENMFMNKLSNMPNLHYFTGMILFIVFIAAMYFAITSGSITQIIMAYFFPSFYLMYTIYTINKNKQIN